MEVSVFMKAKPAVRTAVLIRTTRENGLSPPYSCVLPSEWYNKEKCKRKEKAYLSMIPIILSALLDEETDGIEFETFVKQHQSLMLSAAYAVLRDHHDAEDAVVNALTSIAKRFSAVSKLEPKAKRAYAARCARNCALNIYNVRARRHKNESLAETELPDRAVDGEIDSLIDKLTFEQAVECIVKLDDLYRDVLYLHYVRDMSARQIARELALNRKTVETRILRGKKLLAAIMKGETE